MADKSRRPALILSTHDIAGAQCSSSEARRVVRTSNNHHQAVKEVPMAPARPRPFIRDTMDVSDIEGARPANGGAFRTFKGGSMIVDWARAAAEQKKEGVRAKPRHVK